MALTGDNKAEDRETLPAALLLWHVFRRESRAFDCKAMGVHRVEKLEPGDSGGRCGQSIEIGRGGCLCGAVAGEGEESVKHSRWVSEQGEG